MKKMFKEIQQALEKIRSVTMTTLDDKTMHSRIISICGSDDQGIYFLTMYVKPFYRQLKKNPNVALCGIYPSSRKTGKNEVGQPSFAPRFTLRITGQAREIPEDEVREKGKYLTLILSRKTGTTSFCGSGSPLAEKLSTTPAPASDRTTAAPAGHVLMPAPSRRSFRMNPIVWTVPGAMSAAVVSWFDPRMQLSFPGPFNPQNQTPIPVPFTGIGK